MRTEARMFLGVGAYLVFSAVAYGLLSQESAGTTMLTLAGALALFIGAYLARQGPESEGADDGQLYLPHYSIWPFAMGVGALLVAHGLALGLWALLPGAALLGGAVIGFCRQSRYRN